MSAKSQPGEAGQSVVENPKAAQELAAWEAGERAADLRAVAAMTGPIQEPNPAQQALMALARTVLDQERRLLALERSQPA